MITANDARKITSENLSKRIDKYVADIIEPQIRKAAGDGRYETNVGLSALFNSYYSPAVTEALIKILTEAGFQVKHVYVDDQRDYENSIHIKWGN